MKFNRFTNLVQLIIIGLVVVGCSNTTAWDYYGLNGSVESVTLKKFSTKKINDLWIKGDFKSASEYYFDQKGNIVTIKKFNEESTLIRETSFRYDDDQIKEIIEYDKSGRELNYRTLITEIESNFRILETKGIFINLEDDDSARREVINFVWDENRVVKKIVSDSSEGHLSMRYKYDSNGQEIEYRNFFEYSNMPNKETIYSYDLIEFDDANNWIVRVEKNPFNDSQDDIELGNYEERTIMYFD